MSARILLALVLVVCSAHISMHMTLSAAARGHQHKQQELEIPCGDLSTMSRGVVQRITRERMLGTVKMCTVPASQLPRTMDELFDQVGLTAGAYATPVSPCDGVLLNKDMCLTRQQSDLLIKQEETVHSFHSGRWKRKALTAVTSKWRNKVIPYEIKGDVFSARERALIVSAMRDWERGTCITFRPATRSDTDKVVIQSGMECYSRIGRVGGSQELSLGSGICRTKRVILHELGHALGLIHEHQRDDRDNYVSIIADNVRDYSLDQFNKISRNLVDVESTKYDYRSLMHYGKTFYSKDGSSVTIQTTDPNYQDVIGRVEELSFADYKSINLMYQCSESCPQGLVCLNGGYVGPTCKCVCPDGMTSCTATTVPQTRNTTSPFSKENLPRREYSVGLSSIFSPKTQTPNRQLARSRDVTRVNRVETKSPPKYTPLAPHFLNLLNDNIYSLIYDSDQGGNVTANQHASTKSSATNHHSQQSLADGQGQGQGQGQVQPQFQFVSRQVDQDRHILNLYTSDLTATIQAIIKNGEGFISTQTKPGGQPAPRPNVHYQDYSPPQAHGRSLAQDYPQDGGEGHFDGLHEAPMWMRWYF